MSAATVRSYFTDQTHQRQHREQALRIITETVTHPAATERVQRGITCLIDGHVDEPARIGWTLNHTDRQLSCGWRCFWCERVVLNDGRQVLPA